ncbi:RAB6A-GEF complex partner protein 1 [Schistosoma japonicum]|nr:RAB6A-GEF complex partner protein 1 [Schistosoma japonicum]
MIDNHLHIVLQTADRIILVNRDQLTSRIQTQNITVPKPYINSNWPVRYVAVSTDGKRIAVSGRNGFIHYNCVSQRWHVFGNIKQENSLHVFGGLVWWKQYICLTCFTENYGSSEVRVYSSNHKLDNQFCSVRNLPLLTLPVIVDNFENLFLTLTNDGCLQIFSLSESLSSKTVNHTTTSAGSYSSNNFDPGLYSIESLILNYSGDVFMLQRSAVNASPSNDSETSVQSSLQSLSFGTPVLVASEVEILWSTSCSTSFPSQVSNHHLPSPNGIDINVYAKDSLWLYSGAAGLSVWLPLPRVPNSLAFNFNYGSIRSDTSHKVSRDHVSSPVSNFDHRRIMLSFELGGDFYPLSICFGDDLLVGILNEFHYSWNKSIVHGRENTSSDVFELFPYGTLLIKIQVALHQIIRQLLKKNLGIHAYQMGLAYQHLPYFPRTLELLLYEVLEVEAASKVPTPDPLLPQVVSFIQEFPNSLEILANCSRKTDVTWWPHLFMTVGRKPKDLFELCLENNKLETAASYLILLQTSEPLTVSCECALTLFQASLQSLKWDLIRDLLRFLCAIDPTEYNSVDEHKTKKHCNKSNILHLSPYNHTNDLPNPDNDHLQSKITSEKSIHKIVWYGEMSKYRPTRVTLKLLDFASDQLEDFSGTIKVTSDSLMIDSPKSSSDLRTQLGQLLTKVAVDYFRQGYLKRASQLITNIPEIFNDGHLSCHTNALQTWLNKNVHNIQPVSNWPKVFVNLLEDFIFVETVTNSDEGIHIFSTSADGNLLDSSNIVQIGNTSFSTEPSVVNYDFLSTVSEDTLRQLKCLLNQLASANSDEWMCLISILCLDRDAFFRSVIIAVNCSVLSDSSQLKHESFCPDMTIMNHSRLEKLVANLSELKRWFYEKYPVYHHFLISCEPYIKEIFKKAHQISNDMIDPSMGSPLVISDSVKHGINENQIMKVKNPPASNICDIFEYSKEWHQLDVKQNCSMTSRVLEKDPGPLNNILLPAIDEAVVYFEHNLTNSSVLLNSSTNSHYTSLDNSSCSTPIILTNETAITNHWRSGCRDRWKPVNDFSLLGRLVVLNLDETDIRSGNEDLFDGTTENLVVNPPNPEQRGCLIM